MEGLCVCGLLEAQGERQAELEAAAGGDCDTLLPGAQPCPAQGDFQA